MTDGDDTCGYDTPNGPCQNPATEGGSCWIESHGGHASGHGRPTKLQEHKDEILAAARQGLTYEGMARVAGVGISTLREWRKEYDNFSAALERARSEAERELIEDVDAEFILERSYGYMKTERHELTGEDGGPVETRELSADEKAQLDAAFDDEPDT